MKISKLGPISHFLSPVSCDSLVLQGLRCEWGAGVLNFVLLFSRSHTGHWKFNMAPHGKELSQDLKKALHKDGVGYKTIAKTLKLMAVCWVILRGQQIYTVIQAVHSLLYTVVKSHFFSVVTWKDIIKYLQKCEGCTHFCKILYIS